MLSPTDILDLRHQPETLFDSPETLAELIADDERGPLVAALISHTPALLEHAASLLGATSIPEGDAASRWIAVAATADRPDLDTRIDDRLDTPDGAPSTIDGLMRADVDWYHDALADRVDADNTGFGAAWLLSRAAPGELEEALVDMESTSRILTALRAASLAGEPLWFESIAQWRDHLEDDADDRQLNALDAALATADPTAFARLALMGDVDIAWLADDRAVADFLTRHGASHWCHPLALFRQVRDLPAFELAAAFAICAGAVEPFDDVDDDTLATSDPTRWLRDAPSKTALHLAVAGDDDFAAHLVEATVHHALRRREIQPPAMSGLPLSGPPVDADELDDAMALFDDIDVEHPRDRLALVRTLTDLVVHARKEQVSSEAAGAIIERFSGDVDAVRCLARAVDNDRPVGRIDDWGCRGLHRLLWMATSPTEHSLPALAEAWCRAPVERAAPARAYFAALLGQR